MHAICWVVIFRVGGSWVPALNLHRQEAKLQQRLLVRRALRRQRETQRYLRTEGDPGKGIDNVVEEVSLRSDIEVMSTQPFHGCRAHCHGEEAA